MKSNRCLLIVDDEPELREILKELCAELSDSILVAEDGLEALELVRSNRVDAILSDINMPHMSGLQLLAELRAEGNQVPFVILSAYGDKKNTLEALRLGASDFIEKPFDDEKLLSLMDTVLEIGSAMHDTERETEEFFKKFVGSHEELEGLKKKQTTLSNLKKSYHIRLKKQREK